MSGSFLSGLAGFLQPVAQQLLGQAGGSLISDLLGGGSRVSNSDYQHHQNLADSGNPREIARQNQFLQGVTPTNAQSYNTYQDMTYGADTQRQQERMDTLFPGTSAWERLGTGSATPLPSGTVGPQQGKGEAGQFMSTLVPLKTAEMANKTALAQTKMQTDTQLKIAGQATDQGKLPTAQTAATQAQEALTELQGQKTIVDTNSAAYKQTYDLAEMLLKLSPTDTFEFMGQKSTGPAAGNAIMKLLEQPSHPVGTGDSKQRSNIYRTIPANNYNRLKAAVGDVARNLMGDIASASDYLSKMVRK